MTNEIEKTKRELYGCLDRIRRAGKHRALTAEFEERLEEHLEGLRLELQTAREAFSERAGDAKDLQELRESAGRLIVRNTQLEEALRKDQEGFAEIFMKQRAEIKALQAQADERFEQIQAKQELILSQRQAIKTLRFALASVQKSQEKPSFWGFFSRKKHQAKPLPKKTN